MEFCEILSHKVIVCNDIVNCTIIKDLTLKGKSQICLLWTWFTAYSDLNITHFSANKQVQGIEIIQYIGKGKNQQSANVCTKYYTWSLPKMDKKKER